jgi:FkbM family methyltransferase
MYTTRRCRYGQMTYNTNDIWQGRSFEVYGEYSESEVTLFHRIIREGDVVVEVGANIGSHTVPISRIAGVRKGTVIAFEPERNNFYCLCGNVISNNLFSTYCFNQAVGAEVGTIDVPELDQDKTLNWGGLELGHDYSNVAHYQVQKVTLDSLGLPKLDLLKVDVEGMEADVLRGGVETIKKYRPIMYVEMDRQEKAQELMALIDSMGYIMLKHDAPFFNPMNINGNGENVFGGIMSINLLCIPVEKASDLWFNVDGIPVTQIILSSGGAQEDGGEAGEAQADQGGQPLTPLGDDGQPGT